MKTAKSHTSLIGKAKELEVAGMLIAQGLYVFYPFVDTGFDLVVTNRAGRIFIPVQVKYRTRDPALNLLPLSMASLEGTNAVVAWLIGKKESSWFVPFNVWKEKAVGTNRVDGMRYITISRNRAWLGQYEGITGITTAFESLFDKDANIATKHRHKTSTFESAKLRAISNES